MLFYCTRVPRVGSRSRRPWIVDGQLHVNRVFLFLLFGLHNVMRTQCTPQHSRPRTDTVASIFFLKSLTGVKDVRWVGGRRDGMSSISDEFRVLYAQWSSVAVVSCRGCDDVSGWWAVPRPAPPRTTKYYYYYLYLYTKYEPRRSNYTDYSRVASPVITRAGSSWWETRTPPVCFYFFDTVAHCPVALLLPLRPFVRRWFVFCSLPVVVVFVDIVGPVFWSIIYIRFLEEITFKKRIFNTTLLS